jgi:hypothetical protein
MQIKGINARVNSFSNNEMILNLVGDNIIQ